MSVIYNKAQIDAIMAIIGNRITNETDPATIRNLIDALSDTNFLTDAERSKLASLEVTKFRGTYADLASIPLTGNSEGSTANIDSGVGSDVRIAYWDNDDSVWIDGGQAASETAASIKTKYESNPDTNAYTDAEKAKLAGITDAVDTADAVAALDGAIT